MKFSFVLVFTLCASNLFSTPIVTAEKYVEYKRKNGHLDGFVAPQIVLVCYQQSTLDHLLKQIPSIKLVGSFSDLYQIDDGRVGILGGWGMGAPALAMKIEELTALGVKKFVSVGIAGTLMNRHPIGEFIISPKALAEDGVAHHYLKGEPYAKADQKMISIWNEFTKKHSLPHFQQASVWSFSAIFKETAADVNRVTKLGYDLVDMEAATLYAIGQEKGAQMVSLFVISDSVTQEEWVPHIKEPKVRNNLHKLAEWTVEFCKEEARKSSK